MRALKEDAAARGPRRDRSRSPAASRRPKARRSSAARPAVDLVVGPQSYHRLPELLRARRATARSSTPSFRSRTSSTISPRRAARRSRERGVSAFVTVQEGCDKFCTFCVVPYTRGAEVSRPVAQDRRRGRAAGRCRRARDHAARPERQRLSRRGPGRPRLRRSAGCCTASPTFPASRGCATPPAIRATWTTI